MFNVFIFIIFVIKFGLSIRYIVFKVFGFFGLLVIVNKKERKKIREVMSFDWCKSLMSCFGVNNIIKFNIKVDRIEWVMLVKISFKRCNFVLFGFG